MCMKNCNRCPDEHTSACTKYQPTEEELERTDEELRKMSQMWVNNTPSN